MEVINHKLEKHEKLHNIVVIDEEWTIENNLLTHTMKIKRNAIETIYCWSSNSTWKIINLLPSYKRLKSAGLS